MLQQEFGGLRVSSERDAGIYDAMNRGLHLSRGKYVWFLNGGDECLMTDWSKLVDTIERTPNAIVLFGYELDFGTIRLRKSPRHATYIWHGLPTSHQAIIYPGRQARRTSYDLSYKLSGDYAFTAQLLASGHPAIRSNLLLARFHSGGSSSSSARTVAREAWRVQREILGSGYLRRLTSRARHFGARHAQSLLDAFDPLSRVLP